jgi:hypothetical protein
MIGLTVEEVGTLPSEASEKCPSKAGMMVVGGRVVIPNPIALEEEYIPGPGQTRTNTAGRLARLTLGAEGSFSSLPQPHTSCTTFLPP